MVKRFLVEVYEIVLEVLVFCRDMVERKKMGVPRVMSVEDTIHYIMDNRCSACRYGDGELKLVSGESIRFQEFNLELSQRLAQILRGNGSALVCISDIFDSPKWMNQKAFDYTWHIVAKNRKVWTSHLNLGYLYGNSFISRPYFDWRDKTNTEYWFEELKKIWDGQNIVFIEGSKSRLGYSNDLFANAKSIKRILCPVRNAYSVHKQIFDEAIKQPHDVLFLLALGPTATVLTEDLAENGYWAIDIGHIDIEYEWYKMRATEKIPIKNKYTNEAVGGDEVSDDVNDEFKQQVILEIK